MRNMKNKIYASTVFLLLFMFFAANCFAADGNMNIYSGADETEYTRNVNLFAHLGIFDAAAEIDSVVTRADFVEMLLKFVRADKIEAPDSVKGRFKDLDGENDYMAEYAVSKGYISAYSYDMFRPNDYVLFDEAVKGIVKALGYVPVMNKSANGDIPETSYAEMAQRAGIFKGIVQTGGYPISYGTLIKLFKNALTADLVDYKYYGGRITYFISGGSTVLSDLYNAEKKKGIVTADKYTDVFGDGQTAENGIKIDNVYYDFPQTYENLVGQRVEYYVSGEKLMYVYSVQEDEDFLVIRSDDIDGFKNRTYEYTDEKSKKKHESIPSGCTVIYNGRAVKGSFGTGGPNLKPDNGYVKFIDNNGDGNYDVCIVENFDTMLAESVSSGDMKVFDKLVSGKSLSLKDMKDRLVVILDADGGEKSFDSIKPGYVLSVAKSADGDMIKIIISDKKVSGAIEKITDDAVFMNDTEYETNGIKPDGLRPGKTGSLSLDKDGKAVYFEESGEIDTGYVIKSGFKSGMEDILELKVLTSAGDVEVLKCAKNVFVNDERAKKHTDVYDALGGSGVFTYIKNSSGEICKIYTLYDGKKEDCPNERLQLNSTMANGTVYTAWPPSFRDGKTYFDNNTVIFCIPNKPENAEDTDFYVCSLSALEGDKAYSSETKPLKTYKLGAEKLVADCAVINSDFIVKDYRIGIVTSIARKIDEKRDTYAEIGIFNYGKTELCSLYDSEGINIDALPAASASVSAADYKLAVGDIILYDRLEQDGTVKIKSLRLLYDTQTKKYLYRNASNTAAESTSMYYYGDVYEKNGKYISTVVSGGEQTFANVGIIGDNFDRSLDNYLVEYIGSGTVCKYMADRKNPEVAFDVSTDEIVSYAAAKDKCSKVFVFSTLRNAVLCYIVE